jgi:hypothetical protein
LTYKENDKLLTFVQHVAATSLPLGSACMKMMFRLMLVQFSFIPVISLSFNLVFALSMGKNTVALGLLFFIDSIPVLFGKITSK